MKNKKIAILIMLVFLSLPLVGCTKYVKNDKTIVTNTETGERLVSNVLCKPTKEGMLNLYKENNIDISSLPECNEFKITSNGYEGVWTTIFVKPLAFFIIKLTQLVKNAGLAIILVTLIIRLLLYPITKKTAMQSEIMQLAKPEIDRIEKKYANKTSQQDQIAHSQEIMMVYKKYGINPMSGCVFALIQIPLFFAFYEALNRLPAIFEENFLGFQLGTSPLTAFKTGHWLYIIFPILVAAATFFSFKLNSAASMNEEQAQQMKMMMNISVIFISIASFTMSTGIELYWIFNSGFTIVQNLLVKKEKKNANII